ncbi:Inositol-1-monophosphatase [hydrothermal vent metagenome]|uniref:Inositol-1-monophosphatase n=1 Tax=hydrothermal vent metagenome TaxID=652676 RepID=A0A1W1C375_9ZZZZ
MNNSFLLSCIKANEEIYQKLKDGYEESYYDMSSVGAGGDVSSGLDLWAESIFVKHLGSFGKIESEESGSIGEGTHTIIIDPIDGSSNALSHFPYFGTSVAKIGADGILDSAVVCNLANGDIFLKELQKPLLQGRLFDTTYNEPIVTPNAHIGLFEKAYAHPNIVSRLDELNLKFRAPGAVALSLAYARTVNYLLFVGSYRIYDFAAGLALCEDLTVIVEEDYVIVSKDKDIASKIDSLVRESLYMNSNVKDN